jgi:hypothetical protein
LEAALAGVDDPELRVRAFIRNHLEYFVANQAAMKVLSHEDNVLQGEMGEEVRAIKRRYYQACYALVDELRRQRQALRMPTRLAVLSLFGMMNWLYTWRRPRQDANGGELAQGMADLFLSGLLGGAAPGSGTVVEQGAANLSTRESRRAFRALKPAARKRQPLSSKV